MILSLLELKRHHHLFAQLVVCFISAYRVYFEALREMYPDYEVDCFMNKPFENEDLLRKVASALTTTIN